MKTKFDRWLIQTFIYKTHVYSLQLPKSLPADCHVEELEKKPGKRFNYKLTMPSTRKADKLILLMKEEGLTFKTDVIERAPWYGSLINPRKKSFTWRIFWLIMIGNSIFFALIKAVPFFQSEQFQSLLNSYLGSP